MNGIRIRPFEAAAILAALTLLTGCSLLKFSVDTGGEPLSKEETRMRLLTRGFYYEASDEVTAAADSIAAGSDDAELQRPEIFQDGGDVDALATELNLLAPGTVDLPQRKMLHPDDIVERRIKGHGINQINPPL